MWLDAVRIWSCSYSWYTRKLFQAVNLLNIKCCILTPLLKCMTITGRHITCILPSDWRQPGSCLPETHFSQIISANILLVKPTFHSCKFSVWIFDVWIANDFANQWKHRAKTMNLALPLYYLYQSEIVNNYCRTSWLNRGDARRWAFLDRDGVPRFSLSSRHQSHVRKRGPLVWLELCWFDCITFGALTLGTAKKRIERS